MTEASTKRVIRARRSRAVWLPLVVAAVLAGGMAVAIWLLRGGLPTRIVRHERMDGTPDGWTTLPAALATAFLFPLIISVVLVAVGVAVKQRASMAGAAVGMGVFLTSVLGGGTLAQHARSPWHSGADPLVLIGVALGIPLGIAAWWLCREPVAEGVADASLSHGAEVLGDVADTARVAWTGRTRVSTPVFAMVAAVTVVPSLALAFFSAAHGQWGMAVLTFLTAALIVVLGGCMWARVTIDDRGVRARSFGIKWVTIPLDAVVAARRDDVTHPLGDFGGWGLRSGIDGTRVLLTSAGEALRIERAGKPDWVITLDHADDAARTLNTLVQRRGARP